MTIKEMRSYILDKYPHWARVMRMPSNQVVAIYYKIRKDEEKKARMSDKDAAGYQFTIFDILGGAE